jgi:hypothetical protein
MCARCRPAYATRPARVGWTAVVASARRRGTSVSPTAGPRAARRHHRLLVVRGPWCGRRPGPSEQVSARSGKPPKPTARWHRPEPSSRRPATLDRPLRRRSRGRWGRRHAEQVGPPLPGPHRHRRRTVGAAPVVHHVERVVGQRAQPERQRGEPGRVRAVGVRAGGACRSARSNRVPRAACSAGVSGPCSRPTRARSASTWAANAGTGAYRPVPIRAMLTVLVVCLAIG